MKHALKMLYQRYPDVEKAKEDPAFSENLKPEELLFFRLSLFISNPKKHELYLSKVHSVLQDDELMFFFEILQTFYKKDTKKLNNASNLFSESIKEFDPSEYYKAATFLERIQKEIPNTTLRSVNFWSYLSQKLVIPSPDLAIDTVKFWKTSTIQEFIEKEKKTPKRKKY
ncbi:hypothetical protein QK289_15670 [Exiguobacterium antarcticum]|uniref:Uncharacterized protein n=1 Tax=Exiguobacterium antarcticum TaxID=132920 RepID=A0ABT6R674_9BACL|nr:hypothetical protein [Exiguobacterium antarcticum]MDI3236454.1 hypothetical protein [Exiguobacterium antarcticum]